MSKLYKQSTGEKDNEEISAELRDFYKRFNDGSEKVSKYEKQMPHFELKSIANMHVNDTEIIKFKVYDLFCRYLCCQSSRGIYRTKLYEEGEGKINHYIDILTFIKKMQELDLIKLLFLSHEQIRLLNFLAKPSVSLINNDHFLYFSDNFDTPQFKSIEKSIHDFDTLFDIFKKLLRKEKKDNYDRKLIFLFKNQIRTMIKNNS